MIMADLTVKIAGIRFKNPVVAGSATPTMDLRGMKKGTDGGAGTEVFSCRR
jgi:dihydropyrimidine dehydrogenase (NAD+) subunit PreA